MMPNDTSVATFRSHATRTNSGPCRTHNSYHVGTARKDTTTNPTTEATPRSQLRQGKKRGDEARARVSCGGYCYFTTDL